MQIISIISRKGGVGKSTLTVHLSVLAAKKAPTALIDIDPQGSSLFWSQQRKNKESPWCVGGDAFTLDGLIARAKEAGVEYLFIDTPPKIENDARKAAMVADLCIVPCQPSPPDLNAIGGTLDIIREFSKLKSLIILNGAVPSRGKTESLMARSAREGLIPHRIPIYPVAITRRQALATSLQEGHAVTEVEPRSRAANEMRALWNYIQKELAA